MRLDFLPQDMDVTVVNRSLALLVMLVSLAGPILAGEPTPAQRSNRVTTRGQSQAAMTPPIMIRDTSRKSTNSGEVVGSGVRRAAANPSNANTVQKASAVSRGPVVRTSSQVVDEGVVYESSGDNFVVDEGMVSGGSSCSSCGSGGCDGMACGTSCGTRSTSGWGGCGIDLCNPSNGVGKQLCICLPSHGWAQMDYLMWYQDGMRLPPVLTTSPNGTTQANAGVLGLGSTSILLGNEDILTERLNGGRIRFGWWFANNPNVGVELEYFGMKTAHFSSVNQSTGSPILARPFFNIAPSSGLAREDSELVAFPNVLSGSFSATAFSAIDGSAVRFRRLLCCSTGCGLSHVTCGPVPTQSRIDATIGWRFFQLREGLSLSEDLQSLRSNEPGDFEIQDNFNTRNQFNGVELGVLWQGRRGYWSLDSLLRLSIGNMRQEVIIDGTTVTTVNGVESTASGGLLAQRTNSGTFTRDAFAVVPELGVTLGYQLSQHWRLTAGYTAFFFSNVVRPGDQIDTDVNPNLLPPESTPFTGAERPRFSFEDDLYRQTDYWLQGTNLGAEYRW
jgi:hypothetical protein